MTFGKVVRTYFFDASAIVRLYAREPGWQEVKRLMLASGRGYTSWVLIAESLNVLKRKRRKPDGLSDHEYGRAVFELFSHVGDGTLHALDLAIRDNEPVLVTHEIEVFENRKRFPKLDVADTLQLTIIRESFLQYLAGESATQLVTADKDLAEAAEALRIPVRFLDAPRPQQNA